MENKKITVIVPCYNVEKYVKKSIESILNQTYKNIEIIAIDDCSKDKTFEIIKKIEKENEGKVRVIKNEKNLGLAATRNKGIMEAKTDFIGFIDSDDYIDENYYESLIDAIEKENAEVAITNILIVDEEGKEMSEIQKGINPDQEDIKLASIDNGLCASACNKLFKKSLIEQYLFLEGKINEDVASVIPSVLHANKIAYTDKCKYYYVQRNTSIQNSDFSIKRFDMFDSVKTCLDRINDLQDFEKYKDIIICHQVFMLYIYKIIMIKGFFKRQKFLKLFIKKNKMLGIENSKRGRECIASFPRLQKIRALGAVKLLRTKSPLLINLYLVCINIMSKVIPILRKIKLKLKTKNVIRKNLTIDDLEKASKKQAKLKENSIKVSVVVPNYNYEEYLIQRIYSILKQKEKISELIILDDCSKDNSRELIDNITERLSKYIDIKKIYNTENSGIAFKQWKKGFDLAKGDYVWIAEADDYCDKRLLKVLLDKIRKNNNIRISYVDTAFINKQGEIFLKTIKPEIDLRKTGHWDKDFINNGKNELDNYTFLNCTIANVSSCIIKKDNYDDIFEKATKYRQAGDWVVYANVMIKGDIAYVNKPYNYYRVHGENITSNMKKQKHLEEIKSIHKEIGDLIEIKDWHKEEFQKRYDFLKRVWGLEKENNI